MPAVEVFHEVRGDGEPVVFLNGAMMTTESWGLQTRALAARYRCVLHDFRGQLRTPHAGAIDMRDHVTDLAALLDRLEIESAHVVGTSYGGEVGMLFALAHPHRVRSLAVIASASHVEPPLRQAVTLWRDTALRSPDMLYDVTAPYNFSADALTPLLQQGRERLRACPREFFTGFAAICDAFLTYDVTHRLPDITAPTLVVAGSHDVLEPPHYSEIIAAGIPGARLQVLDGPHALVIEKSDEVNAALLEHLP